MFQKFLFVLVISFLLAACAPGSSSAPSASLTATQPAWSTSCTVIWQTGDRLDVRCPVQMTIRTKFQGAVVMEEKRQVTVDLMRMPGTKKFMVYGFENKMSWVTLSELEQQALQGANARVLSPLGSPTGNLFNVRYDGYPGSGTYTSNFELIDFMTWRDETPFNEWIFNFTLDVKNDPISEPRDWSFLTRRAGDTTYVNYQSPKGRVEIPIRDSELTYLLQGKFLPTVAQEVQLKDPAATTGKDKYEENVLRYATQIKNEGMPVGRFEWTDFESQEVILRILGNALIIKAVTQPGKSYQAAWYGFVREKQVVSTDIAISSRGSSGSFFLGIGTLTGGSSLTSIRQQQSPTPAIFGDLYLLAK